MRAGRHRATGRTAAAATALVAAAAALLATTPLERRGPAQPHGIPPVVVPGRTAPAAPAPPQSSSQPAGGSRTFVAESPPTLVEAPSIGLRAAVTPYTPAQVAAQAGAVEPSSLWEVVWWTGGGTPGSHAGNTVYLYGHTWKEPAVFNRLKELEPGASVIVTTRTGCLEYVVVGSFTVAKAQLSAHPAVRAARAGRLLLIGCHRESGQEDHTTRNIVVVAHLR